jgi:hypothetical protein
MGRGGAEAGAGGSDFFVASALAATIFGSGAFDCAKVIELTVT